MSIEEKKILSREAAMQMRALKTIRVWMMIAIAVSTLGAALLYAGLAGTNGNLLFHILGILLMVSGLAAALIINLGLKNGRKNVEKILDRIQEDGL